MRRGLAIWLLIILAETIHGMLRELILVPRIGAEASSRIGWPLGLVLVYLIAILSARWIGLSATTALLHLGLVWAGLTFLFEIVVGLARSYDAARILAELNPAQGGLMGVGLIVMALAPLLAARLRGLRS
jgi:hypothetical protein